MLELLSSPFIDTFEDFYRSVRAKCFLCSPYITQPPIRRFIQCLEEKGIRETVQLQVLTDISAANIVQGSTDLDALILLAEAVPSMELRYLPRVHAKVFLANDVALLGSANLTNGGISGNYEYGVRLRDHGVIGQIWQDMARYAQLGASVTADNLSALQTQAVEIRSVTQQEQKLVRDKMRPLTQVLRSEILTQNVEDRLAEIRVTGRTIHAIFCETLLYLLAQRDMTAQEMAEYVQKLHPDMCDDAVDRVINGQSFGKKWKHHVRTARGTLQRKALIRYQSQNDNWTLCAKDNAK